MVWCHNFNGFSFDPRRVKKDIMAKRIHKTPFPETHGTRGFVFGVRKGPEPEPLYMKKDGEKGTAQAGHYFFPHSETMG
jgi:hypothetical protein